jgi:hypothetical protein
MFHIQKYQIIPECGTNRRQYKTDIHIINVDINHIPSGNLLHSYGKSPFSMGKSIIIFH